MDDATQPSALPPSFGAPKPALPAAGAPMGGAPAAAAMPTPVVAASKPRFWKKPGFKRGVSIFTLLAIVGTCGGLYAKATFYGKKVVESHPVDARIEMSNSPTYLDRKSVV